MRFITFVLIFLIIGGCEQKSPANLNSAINDLKLQVGVLENKNTELESKISNIYDRANLLEQTFAAFSPSSKGYASVKTNVGYFLINLEKLTKSPGGYKAVFLIGNPSSITFQDMTLSIGWGTAFNPNANRDDWIKSLHRNQIEIDKPILPGVWNRVAVILSPATDSEVGFISCNLFANHLFLYPDYREF